jgi:hypothetical protein
MERWQQRFSGMVMVKAKYRPGRSEPILIDGEKLLKPALKLMSFYRLRIDKIKEDAVVTLGCCDCGDQPEDGPENWTSIAGESKTSKGDDGDVCDRGASGVQKRVTETVKSRSAIPARLPDFVEPMKAKLVGSVPVGA